MTAPARACPACHTPLPDDARFCLACGVATPVEPGVPPRDAPPAAAEMDRVRRALGDRYRIERVLGQGGMATVYLAEDPKHRRKVAVKVMRPELAATLGADRFLREIEIAAQLSHPHILPVHDSGSADGILYYVMPYVEGESLRERVHREGALPPDVALQLGREVAEALGYAHRRGIIHRDIKPANVMLGEGHALVADFGIARATEGGQALTQTGLSVGTPQYMSPEQATGERDIDARSDVYAIGTVLYEMLSGQPPYSGSTPQAVLAKSLTEEAPPLATVRSGVPAEVAAVVAKAMARRPADRYASGVELEQALAEARDGMRSGTVGAVSAGPSPAKVWGLFGGAAVVSMAVIYGLVTRWGLPSWTFALAAVLLAAGATMLVATGRFEAQRRGGKSVGGVGRWFTWARAAWGGGLAALLWVAVAVLLVFRGPEAGGATGGVVRLAVLPFENRGEASDAYFVDGVTDQVRGKLTSLGGFQVTARTSSDQYRRTTKTPQEIGRELGVEYLLTATVNWARSPGSTGRVQVVPELIDVRTGAATWQETFDAELTDVFQVQTGIATRVAAALGVALGATEQRQLAERPTANLAAYDLYLKGRALTGNDVATLRQAAEYFEQAAALDSGFADAWAQLSRALTLRYTNGTPDPALGNRARETAARALALDPHGAPGHVAMSRYYMSVRHDPVQGEAEMALALQAAPNDPEILRFAGTTEQTLGRWDDALAHFERARRLDPRSEAVVLSLADQLRTVRRYSEAAEAYAEALALAPGDLNAVEGSVMLHLAQGDLAGARAVLRDVPASVAEPTLIAYVGLYQDLYWVLDDRQQQLLLRLAPSAFFDDRTAWGSVLMETYWLRGDRVRARAYADSARTAFEEQLRDNPGDPQRHVLYGLALAYLGRYPQAIAEGERGVALGPVSSDATFGPYFQHQLARIYLLAGQPEKALDQLEPLLRMPYYLSPGWLRIDPTFAPLRGNPRFERLIAQQ
jgi:eukaryotic-like serine/threonine-protein kinase